MLSVRPWPPGSKMVKLCLNLHTGEQRSVDEEERLFRKTRSKFKARRQYEQFTMGSAK